MIHVRKICSALLLAAVLLLSLGCFASCGERGVVGKYVDESGYATYEFSEDGSVKADIINYTFTGSYVAEGGKITITLQTSQGDDVQSGTYEGDTISLDAGEGFDAFLLTKEEA